MDRHLNLQLADPPLGRGQLCQLRRGRARFEAAVDAVRTPPVVDRLIADPKVAGDVSDLAATLEQIRLHATQARPGEQEFMQRSRVEHGTQLFARASSDHLTYEASTLTNWSARWRQSWRSANRILFSIRLWSLAVCAASYTSGANALASLAT